MWVLFLPPVHYEFAAGRSLSIRFELGDGFANSEHAHRPFTDRDADDAQACQWDPLLTSLAGPGDDMPELPIFLVVEPPDVGVKAADGFRRQRSGSIGIYHDDEVISAHVPKEIIFTPLDCQRFAEHLAGKAEQLVATVKPLQIVECLEGL